MPGHLINPVEQDMSAFERDEAKEVACLIILRIGLRHGRDL
jgi:hypothetical protein